MTVPGRPDSHRVRNSRPRWTASLHSLQFKASLFVVVLVLAVTIGGAALSMRAMSTALYGNELERTSEWAVSLAAAASGAVEHGDRLALSQTVNDLMRSGSVAYVAFTDVDGRLLARGESSPDLLATFGQAGGGFLGVEPVHQPKIVVDERLDLGVMDISVPVFGGSTAAGQSDEVRQLVGYLRLARHVTDMKTQLDQTARHLGRVALSVVLLVLPCSLLVTRRVVSPLNELSRTARAIASGSTDERANVSCKGEIGELAVAFNTMADRFTQSRLELLELNAELEQRVMDRTRELEELASCDPLTGLYNRRYFSEVIAREFAAARRYGDDLTCLMFDVDHFKETNDRYGHRTGDEVLILLARTIQQQLRESDVAARFGGDEFVVLLPQTPASAASGLAERIRNAFNERRTAQFPKVPASVSIGAASLQTTCPSTAEDLLHEADVALYAAKDARRLQLHETPPDNAVASSRT